MDKLIPVVGTVALLGSALVGGIFFAFSSFIMKALARMPSEEGTPARAFIMKLENAKKIPPTRAEPSRAIVPTTGISWSIPQPPFEVMTVRPTRP